MKNELGGRIMAEFAELIPKPYRYLIDDDDDDENKKRKGHKKVCHKRNT